MVSEISVPKESGDTIPKESDENAEAESGQTAETVVRDVESKNKNIPDYSMGLIVLGIMYLLFWFGIFIHACYKRYNSTCKNKNSRTLAIWISIFSPTLYFIFYILSLFTCI